MSQHDMNIGNQGFPQFRGDLNNALTALSTLNSGTAAPPTRANMFWYDTAQGKLRVRNSGNTSWFDFQDTLDVGTNPNQILQLDGNGRIPAVDGSQITNLNIPTVPELSWGSDIDAAGANVLEQINIPSGVSKIKVHLKGLVHNSSTPSYRLQIGTSIGYKTSGYSVPTSTDGFRSGTITGPAFGSFTLERQDNTNTWLCEGTATTSGSFAGYATLGTPLTRIRLTEVLGTLFSSGSIVVSWI